MGSALAWPLRKAVMEVGVGADWNRRGSVGWQRFQLVALRRRGVWWLVGGGVDEEEVRQWFGLRSVRSEPCTTVTTDC